MVHMRICAPLKLNWWLILLLAILVESTTAEPLDCDAIVGDDRRTQRIVMEASRIRYDLRKVSKPDQCETFIRSTLGAALEAGLIKHSDEDKFSRITKIVELRANCFEQVLSRPSTGLRSLIEFMNQCASTTTQSKSVNNKIEPMGVNDQQVHKIEALESNTLALNESLKQKDLEILHLKQVLDNYELIYNVQSRRLDHKTRELENKEKELHRIRNGETKTRSQARGLDNCLATLDKIQKKKVELLEQQITNLVLANRLQDKQHLRKKAVYDEATKKLVDTLRQCNEKIESVTSQQDSCERKLAYCERSK